MVHIEYLYTSTYHQTQPSSYLLICLVPSSGQNCSSERVIDEFRLVVAIPCLNEPAIYHRFSVWFLNPVIDHGIGGKDIRLWRVLLRPDAGVSNDELVCHHPISQPHNE